VNNDYLPLLILFSGPLAVGAVIGAWLAAGRLFVIRFGGMRLPVGLPWVIAPLVMLVALVVAATQLLSGGVAPPPGSAVTPAAIVSLLLTPTWMGESSLAVLGIVLHYFLDPLLLSFKLHPVVTEGLALGLRAAWVVIGLLTLLASLYGSFVTTRAQYGLTVQAVLAHGSVYLLLINLVALAMGIFGMIMPWLMERAEPPQES